MVAHPVQAKLSESKSSNKQKKQKEDVTLRVEGPITEPPAQDDPPCVSTPATLQLFLPKSIPSTAICIGPLPFPLVAPQATRTESENALVVGALSK